MTGLTQLSPSAPHTHALDHRGSLRPHLRPHDITAGPLLSPNWSGQIEAGATTTFSGVQGSWTVPAVPDTPGDEASSTWIGIDGVEASSLIQTGTNQNSGPDFAGTQYEAWVELLPGAEEVLGTSTGPAPVEPGDQMTASILETSTDFWTVVLDDLTQAWTFSDEFAYSTPGVTAEWIEEASTLNGSVATLPDYGSTTFTDLGVTGTNVSSAVLVPVYIASDSGAITSYPEDYDADTDSFSVFYGSPSPQVTTLTPDEGSTGGGTSVTIGGNFVTGVTAVNFGGVSVPFTADLDDGTVSTAAPPASAGTVDVTVTTPGGTSQPSTADEFTYVTPAAPPLPPPPAPSHGYWLVGSDGGIFSFGSAQFYGSTGSLNLQRPVVGMVPTEDEGGYWLDASDGGVFAFGDAGYDGSIPGLGLHPAGSGLPDSLDAPIVGMVASADGGGYFMVASDGGVFAFGDAHFAGSCPGIGGCSGAAVAVMPDASGDGYWLVTKSGAVYSFGDAPYFGAPGRGTVTSAVATPDGQGYWILLSDGDVLAYGDASELGSPSSANFDPLDYAAAIFATSDGAGYWVTSAQGAVFDYGDAPDDGGMSGTHLNGSIIAATGF